VLRDDEASFADPPRELSVCGRIVAVDAAAEHGDREPARIERATMGFAIDAAREPADDDQARPGDVSPEHARDLRAVRRAGPRADDRYRRTPENIRIARTAEIERAWWIVDLPYQPRQFTAPEPPHRADRLGRRPTHAAASSFGARNESASATCSGWTDSAPASAATVAETRATRARPRADSGSRSTARDSSSFAASTRRGRRSRKRSPAATTLARTSSEASDGAAASSTARGRGTVTSRSKRSSRARESLSRYAANR